MNNADLAKMNAAPNGLNKSDARKIVDGVFAAIVDTAASGNEIAISGFGKFKAPPNARAATLQQARPSRSPHRRS